MRRALLVACLVAAVKVHAAAPAVVPGYLSLEEVKQCLRARSHIVEQHEVLLREKARMDAEAEQFRAEAGDLRATFTELETRSRRQLTLEAGAGRMRTGRNLSDADLAAIDAELVAAVRSREALEQARGAYNRQLADHNRRFALHYSRTLALNRRLEQQHNYSQMADARCTRNRILHRDLAAAQSAIASENAAHALPGDRSARMQTRP